MCTNQPFHHSSIPDSSQRAPPRTRKIFTSTTKGQYHLTQFQSQTLPPQIFLNSNSPPSSLTKKHHLLCLETDTRREHTLQKIVAGAQGRPDRFGPTNPPPQETQRDGQAPGQHEHSATPAATKHERRRNSRQIQSAPRCSAASRDSTAPSAPAMLGD